MQREGDTNSSQQESLRSDSRGRRGSSRWGSKGNIT